MVKELAIFLSFSLVFSTLLSFFDSFILFFCWLIFMAVWVLRHFFKSLQWIFQKQFSAFLKQLFTILLGLALYLPTLLAGNYVHLAIMYPTYRKVISTSPDNSHRFNWSESGFAGYNSFTILVYYPTTASRAGTAKHIASSREAELRREIGGNPAISTRHLIGHFYIENIAW